MNAVAQGTPAEEEFQRTETQLRRFRTLVALALGVVLMPAGAALDWALYRDHFASLLTVRLLTTAVLAAGLLAVWWLPSRWRVEPLSVVLVLLPSLAISLMMYLTDGSASTYYFGLILLMIMVNLLGFGLLEALVYCGATIGAYWIAVRAHVAWGPVAEGHLVEGMFFLVTSGVVCVAICELNRRYRRNTFLLQRQLRHQAQQRLDFVANVSHELRTPLSLIVAPLDEMLSSRGRLSEAAGQRLSMVRRNVDRLRLLVDDLLDVVRQRDSTVDLQWEDTDARDFVEQVVALTRDTAASIHLRLVIDGATEPLPIRADVARLERVLMNLLGNAFKFAPPGSTVRMTVGRDGDRALIQVADEGPGIPESLLKQIFTRLYQADNVKPEQTAQGLGLGLAISKQIVQWHHGEISAENRPDGGAVFSVWLPLVVNLPKAPAADSSGSAAALEAAQPSAAADGDSLSEPGLEDHLEEDARGEPAGAAGEAAGGDDDGGDDDGGEDLAGHHGGGEATGEDAPAAPRGVGRVLVIDDEPDLRGYLADSLRLRYEVEMAATAAGALEVARRQRPHCILLDLMLPDAHRLSALETLRDEPELKDTKILMLTANADESIKIEALRAGADDFLPKPFGISEIEARVAGLVQSCQLQSELREERRQLQESLRQLKESQLQLFHSEKMRAVAGLAGGLLHEINNPVNFSLMAVRTLQKRAEPESVTADTLQDIHDGMIRISDIVGDLRSFAHPEQERTRTVFCLSDAARSAQRFAQHELGDIPLVIQSSQAMRSEVLGAQSQIIQVLLNLILNSVHATHRRGEQPAGEIVVTAAIRQQRVAITVADHGIGLTADQLQQVREPFYSTGREPGEGLGLGLSICESIVRGHDGELVIESEFGQGTRVTFDLPLHAAAEPAENAADAVADGDSGEFAAMDEKRLS